jgi:short subunit dehydrogenase-like uncharacterized protein
MSGSIVLFGATGYTGGLTAHELVRRGARPVLAGRNEDALAALSAELGGGFETRAADVERPASVRELLAPGDVIVTTVGPFTRWGAPAVEAAIAAGAPYIDSTGEPPHIRRVFERWSGPAARTGAPLLTAMGYDWVPGNLAAALALREAGEAARRIEVGYFLTGGGGGYSGGTMASTIAALTERGFAYRDGALRSEANARRLRSFPVRGRDREAVSASSSEHFAVPALFPNVREVDVYLGWFGGASRRVQVGSLALDGVTRLPGARPLLERALGRFARGSSGGPSEAERERSGSHVLAIARDRVGESLAEVRLEGVNGYTFTAGILAWAAQRALAGEIDGAGAVGPAAAFGIDALERGCAEAGIERLPAD